MAIKPLPEEMSISFQYTIGTEVFFLKDGQAYRGVIDARSYKEVKVYQDQSEPAISIYKQYEVKTLNFCKSFKETDFGYSVYTDKMKFIDKEILIR